MRVRQDQVTKICCSNLIRKNMKFNLQFKLLVMALPLSFVLLFLTTFNHIHKYQDLLEQGYLRQAAVVAQALDASIRSREDLEDRSLLWLTIQKHIWLNPNILEINVNRFIQDKMVIFVSNNLDAIGTVADPKSLEAYEKDILIYKPAAAFGQSLLTAFSPIHLSGQKLGTYQVVFSLEEVSKLVEREIKEALLLYLLIALVLGAFMFYFSKIITKPLAKLTAVTQALAGGDLTKRADMESKDEIGQLGQAFNQMASQLQEYYGVLEQKVKERTAETEEAKKKLEVLNQELQKKLEELERTNKLMVGRELKMAEMKKEIEKLKGT